MVEETISDIYRNYIACLNRQDWPMLRQFVAEGVIHNGRPFGLTGYRQMLEGDFAGIPDLSFNVDLMIADKVHVASRLVFDCSPRGDFLGLPVNGKRIQFSENVLYAFHDGRIAEVWSIVDKAVIEPQLGASTV